ncbi:efflux RND transporter periplasmic adaptor subunit [Psychromonas sp.]|uniref:efflux RND transporter periplasmic adaptor subunit n=1 Tax=Psychromonas sp. TaxID=1884585 RepID=UPI00356509E8
MVYIRKKRGFLLLLAQLTWLPAFVSGAEVDPLPSELQSLDCVINPSVVADLGSSVPGVLSSIRVDRSDFVHSGDIIAVLESKVDMASLELARTRAALTAEIDLRRINADFGQRQSRRIEDLYSREMVSNKEMDQTQTETNLTRIQLRQALDNQKLAQLELLRAQEVVDRNVIRSPITGVIMERFKTLGEYVDAQAIVRVAQLSPLHVEVIIPVEQLGKVHPGMLAEVWTDSIDGKWQAEVSRIDRVADVASGTFGVRLTLENPDYKIPAGLRCRVSFLPSERVAEPETTSVNDFVSQKITDMNHTQGEQCGWLGPYPDFDAAQQKATALRINGVYSEVQKRKENVQTGTLVLSPAFDSKKQVDVYLRRLREAGDKDHFQLAQSADQSYYVSLGYYSQNDSTEKRIKQLQSKGFSVETQPRYTLQERYWLLVNGNFSLLDADTQQELENAAKDKEITPCNLQIAAK